MNDKKTPAKSWHKGFRQWFVELLSKGIFKKIAWVNDRQVGYVKVHPIKHKEEKAVKVLKNGRYEHRATNNHSKGESKKRRKVAAQSRKINRR